MDNENTLSPSASEDEEFLSLEQAVQFLGTSKPTLYRWLAQEELKGFKAGKKWRFRKVDLNAFLNRRPAMPNVPQSDLEAEIGYFAEKLRRLGGVLPEIATEETDPETNQVCLLAAQIMTLAIQSKASDIHLEPVKQSSESYLRLRTRIDGVLYDTRRLPLSLHEALLLCYKQRAKMEAAERRMPQQGRLPLRVGESDFEMRVSTLPTPTGEEMVMRILHKGEMLSGLENLGLSSEDAAKVSELMQQPSGLLLIAGPTGSGKTTLLYNLIQQVVGEHRKIVTLEEPIELSLPYATQVALNSRGGLNSAEGMRALMRHDPDVILLSELKDRATLELACEAALTGHLVLAAVNAPGAAATIQRLLDSGTDPVLLTATLLGIISTRLLRKVCPNCKQTYSVRAGELRRFGFEVENPEESLALARGAGCEQCRKTGYKGRMGLFEVMTMNSEIAAVIERNGGAEMIEEVARANGMRSLREDGFRKILDGLTTPDEVLRVVHTSHF